MPDAYTEKNLLYQRFIYDEARKSSITVTVLAIFLFPIFTFLDYFSHQEKFLELSAIRFSTSLIFFLAFLLLRKGIGIGKPFLSLSILLSIASLSITLMCVILTGSESPYYAGVNLVVLAGVLILPKALHAGINASIVIAIYLIGILIRDDFQLINPVALMNNLFFLISTAIIGVTASYVKDRIRKELFFRNLEVTRSMEVLQKELQSGHGNIESLASEIVMKKGEVQNSLELRDSFISMASHELKTPLTAMKLQMEVARRKIRKTSDPEHVSDLIESADSQLSRMLRIVDEMLDVSRIQSGKFIIEKKEVNFSEMVTKLINRSFLQQVEKGHIRLTTEENIHARIDPFKIEQVMVNLINNALRYGGGKDIEVKTYTEKQSAVFSVSDHGPGIKPEDIDKIFEKYERGNVSKSGGLGLGLYISKEIIEAHDGTIKVESSFGEGSTFTICLPLT